MRPEPLRGGLFADDIELGKTLTLLSLNALDKCGSALASADASVYVETLDEMGEEGRGGRKCKRGRTSKMNCSGPQKKGKISGIDTNFGRTSLVVCPSSGLSSFYQGKTAQGTR